MAWLPPLIITASTKHTTGEPMNTIGQNVRLSPDAVLGQQVTIGSNVTIYPGVTIGDGCTIIDGAVIGRPPLSAGNTTRPINTAARPLYIGAGSIVGANAVLYTGITIGQRVLIGDLASIREGCVLADDVVIGRSVLIMYDTHVGERTRVIDGAILTGNMLVEPDVFIGPGVSSVNDNDVYLKRFGLEPFSVRGPVVRRFALIGTSAILAAEVEIGMGALVAPGAVVTHDVAAWTVVAGIPAREVRKVDDEQRQRLLAHFGLDKDGTEKR
jgi:acetyltransferase-like isoleucine patch superfamily enzyme